ncbi:hypothetical protein BHYA_0115g00350 [Botrytis hyacinthi]|uniref:Uncharacterized protein n=1 Tax=Botrytis hyacinthi TaxID=278943 RepID=A0A4Z1GIM4_9HELO|nr:hypothetical protein BHYA_0115g00350 [Botrytis hyacinthi]
MFLDNLRQRSPSLRSQPPYLISFRLEHPALDVFSERYSGIGSSGPRIGIEVFYAGVVERSFDFESEDDLRPGVAAGAVVEPDVVEGAEGEDEGFFGGGKGYGRCTHVRNPEYLYPTFNTPKPTMYHHRWTTAELEVLESLYKAPSTRYLTGTQLQRLFRTEQARHLPGGELHSSEPWLPRSISLIGFYTQYRKCCAKVDRAAALPPIRDVPVRAPQVQQVPVQVPQRQQRVLLQAPPRLQQVLLQTPPRLQQVLLQTPSGLQQVPLEALHMPQQVPVEVPQIQQQAPVQAPQGLQQVPIQVPQSQQQGPVLAPMQAPVHQAPRLSLPPGTTRLPVGTVRIPGSTTRFAHHTFLLPDKRILLPNGLILTKIPTGTPHNIQRPNPQALQCAATLALARAHLQAPLRHTNMHLPLPRIRQVVGRELQGRAHLNATAIARASAAQCLHYRQRAAAPKLSAPLRTAAQVPRQRQRSAAPEPSPRLSAPGSREKPILLDDDEDSSLTISTVPVSASGSRDQTPLFARAFQTLTVQDENFSPTSVIRLANGRHPLPSSPIVPAGPMALERILN